MLRVFVDDSADERQEKVVAAGAFMAYYGDWSKLRDSWKKRFRRDGLRYFRTTECYSLRGEFSRFRDPVKYPKPAGSDAARTLLEDLETIINKTQIMGLAVCIPLEMYNDLRENEAHAKAVFPADAFQIALISLLMGCAEIVRDEFNAQEKLHFTCDESNRSHINTDVYIKFRKNNPKLSEFINGFTHLDDRKFPPLQAADLMAHIARKRFSEWLDDPRKAVFTADATLKARLKKLKVHRIQAWDRKYMLAVLEHEKKRRNLV